MRSKEKLATEVICALLIALFAAILRKNGMALTQTIVLYVIMLGITVWVIEKLDRMGA